MQGGRGEWSVQYAGVDGRVEVRSMRG